MTQRLYDGSAARICGFQMFSIRFLPFQFVGKISFGLGRRSARNSLYLGVERQPAHISGLQALDSVPIEKQVLLIGELKGHVTWHRWLQEDLSAGGLKHGHF